MTRLPSLGSTDVIRALQRGGFEVVRSSGSHHRLVHHTDPARATTVPVHKGRDLSRSLLHAIIKQSGLTVEEFLQPL
ncbi:MAG: type II toxin-antitoxin system HicA family toxin [Gammaproteobacteria bacterium]